MSRKKLRFADEIRKRYGKCGNVLQPWRGSGGNCNFPVTFDYLVC